MLPLVVCQNWRSCEPTPDRQEVAVKLETFIFTRYGLITGWGTVLSGDAETEARFGPAGGRLRPDEWAKGDSCWLVEVIAPFCGTDTMLEDLAKGALKGKAAKMQRSGPDGLTVATLEG